MYKENYMLLSRQSFNLTNIHTCTIKNPFENICKLKFFLLTEQQNKLKNSIQIWSHWLKFNYSKQIHYTDKHSIYLFQIMYYIIEILIFSYTFS